MAQIKADITIGIDDAEDAVALLDTLRGKIEGLENGIQAVQDMGYSVELSTDSSGEITFQIKDGNTTQ
jgi:uncharacterized protein YoxC